LAAGACELTASAHEALAALDEAGLTRRLRSVERCGPARVQVDGREVVSFASCDYLGLSVHPRLCEAAARAARDHGTSAGSARLLSGHDPQVDALEQELAAFFGAPAALVFSSGYLANLGLVTGLAGPGDLLVSDALVHASTVDACRLSGADVVKVAHDDVDAVAKALAGRAPGARALVLVEGVYSMDGDLASLPELSTACAEYGAHLLVDDAHGLGVVGPGGRGAAAATGAPMPALQVGNLGKSLGSYGAFVLLDEPLRELLLQTARSFVFTCALPPTVVAAAREALAVLREEPERIDAAQERAAGLRAALHEAGVPGLPSRPGAGDLRCNAGANAGSGGDSHGVWDSSVRPTPRCSPIIPVVLGDGARALAASSRLLERGWLAPAVRPPTVPRGGERLRLTVSSEHTDAQCRALARDLAEILT
jgi:7-keto-8-aminopelargonate synthetase-like enzyme